MDREHLDAEHLDTMSIDELWALHAAVDQVLALKLIEEMSELDKQLARLGPAAWQKAVKTD